MTIVAIALILLLGVRELQNAKERIAAARERDALLQRIQAPQQAVAVAARDGKQLKPARTISADDDATFELLRKERG